MVSRSPGQSLVQILRRLWPHIDRHRRFQLGLLLILMILASLAELISIGAIIPFLGILSTPERLNDYPLLGNISSDLLKKEPYDLLLISVLAFSAAALFSGSIRLIFLWFSLKISYAIGSDLSSSMYQKTLYQPYSVHVSRNTSVVIDAIAAKAELIINSIVIPMLTLLLAAMILVLVLGCLISFDPVLALILISGTGLIYLSIILLTKKILIQNSTVIAKQSTGVIKALQEGLGGIRDVLVSGAQKTYYQIYHAANEPLRRAQGYNKFIAQSPRYMVESIGMVLMALLAYQLAASDHEMVKVVPILGVIALAAQRLLPIMQSAYLSWSNMQGSMASVGDALELLDQPIPDNAFENTEPFKCNQFLELNNITFRYSSNSPAVLSDINLRINRGSRIGIIGATGSGKSTLIDIVMGLLEPSCGKLLVDGVPIRSKNIKAWQKNIAHVPQNIFLSDASVAENIAFGVPRDQIDYDRVRISAKQAQLDVLIQAWPDGYMSSVGERGVRLSGGQRQRIGIARALYRQADVIILDEATSALDNKTESSVMSSLDDIDSEKMLLIVAHRLTTLRNCSQIIELEAGRVKRICAYQDLDLDDLASIHVGRLGQ